MTTPTFLDAILVDEVGIESGLVNGFLLKSAYQPIFSPIGDSLQVTAIDASTHMQRDGTVCGLDELHKGPHPVDRDFLAGLCQTLHIDNHRNLSPAGCDLFLDHDLLRNRRLGDALLDAARHARAVGEAVLDAHQVFCRTGSSVVQGEWGELLEELRAVGFRLVLDAFDGGSDPRFKPDVAEVNRSWFPKIAAQGAAAKLLRPLVDAHRADGTKVLIRGISTADQLRLSIEAGADYLCGDYLAPPVLAGTVIDDAPKTIGHLLEARRSGTVHAIHQRR